MSAGVFYFEPPCISLRHLYAVVPFSALSTKHWGLHRLL